MRTFLGYPRENGQVGIRNVVGVLSVMDNVNPVTRSICSLVYGTMPITTLFVRGQFGLDAEITYRTLSGLAANPNVAAVLVVGLESTTTAMIAEMVRTSGKPVEQVVVQDAGGTIAAMAEGVRKATGLVIGASRRRRQEVPVSELIIGVECGGSDTTSGLTANPAIGVVSDTIVREGGKVYISETSEFLGAEHIFAERAKTPAIRESFLKAVHDVEQDALERGVDIRGTNPVPDNIRGGLTTIEEKSLGAMVKAGTSPIVGVLKYAEQGAAPGLYFMDTPAPAVESMTGMAGGGCQMILFATGQGNTIGSMVAPTVKVTGNSKTARSVADNIDFNVEEILTSGKSIDATGGELFEFVLDVASGTLTSAEVLRQQETAVSRFGQTI